MRIHFLGIGGTLMGNLALLAMQRGHAVSGSDQGLYPPMSEVLAEAGIETRIGWDPAHLEPAPDLVVVGNANLPRGNPALEAVLDRGLPYTSGAEWLGREILTGRRVIAVSGTHGKTTTTAMIVHILEHAGLAPGFLIGGVGRDFETAARLGESPLFVVEADEYDTSYFDRRAKFVHYRPRTLIINNLEWDHADIYPDLGAIQQQFALLLRTVPATGLVIAPADAPAVDEVFDRGLWTPLERIGPRAEWQARPTGKQSFEVCFAGQRQGEVRWSLIGAHNRHNALAAIAAARHAGVDVATACAALATFRGVKRRLEVIGSGNDITVYDDFAHHPTAIAATLGALREHVGEEEIVAVIEPRSHTMSLGALQERLADCTAAADRVWWRRTDRLEWNIAALAASPGTVVADDPGQIVADLAALPKPARHRHVVIMSNGAFDGIHPRIVEALCGAR